MKNRKGLTLIEVMLAMLILSILLVTYITIFGQSTLLVSRGKNITNETFNHQDMMENNIIDIKKKFISGEMVSSNKITIFSGKYKSEIDVIKVEIKIKNNRKYTAFVSNFEIKEPKPPRIDPFKVKIYNKDKSIEVFPWKDDNVRLVAEYGVKNDPLIFEKRTRWYSSVDREKNPVFASDYEVLSENEKKEPLNTFYTEELAVEKILAKKFYYFEARVYTFAGRLEHFKNEERILVLNRAGSSEWQDFIEKIYFKNNQVKRFIENNQTLYMDIMQNPNHPTLNLDWSENKDPEGALVGIKIPDEYVNENFQTSVKFQIDQDSEKRSCIGIGLVDIDNSGFMIDINSIENSINVNKIESGKNIGLIKKMNSLIDGELDWSKEYDLKIEYYKEDKIRIKLEDDDISSEFIEINLENSINPKYVGLKSYSNIDYMPNLKYEIKNKYDRNYSSHFYDVEFGKRSHDGEWTVATKNIFYSGESNNISKGREPNLKIKMSKKDTQSAGSSNNIVAKAFWFSPEIEKLVIKNHPLVIKAEEVIFDVPIEFGKSKGIEISGVNNKLYPIKVSFQDGQKIKINNSEMILDKDQYIFIKSGSINLNSTKGIDVIEISGSGIYSVITN